MEDLVVSADHIYAIIGFILAVSGAIYTVLYWFYKRGQTAGMDAACERRIKDKIADNKKSIEGLGKRIDKEINHANESHKKIHDKIDKTHERIDQVDRDISKLNSNVGEIKGSIDTAIEFITKKKSSN